MKLKHIKLFEDFSDDYLVNTAIDNIRNRAKQSGKKGTIDELVEEPENAAQKEYLKNFKGRDHFKYADKYKKTLSDKKAEGGDVEVAQQEEGRVEETIGDVILSFDLERKDGDKVYGKLTIGQDSAINDYDGFIKIKNAKADNYYFEDGDGVELLDSSDASLIFGELKDSFRVFINNVAKRFS